ncbi:MAG: RHS repeat-associated core domain-containing protein [Methylococcales bacterium]
MLGETVGITGTPFSLNYESGRVPGRKAAYTLPISLSGATVPASLKRIELEIMIAGQMFTQSFSNAANQSTSFPWDGKDAYGRTLQGQQVVTVRIGYVYDGVYQQTDRFGYNGNGLQISGSRTRREVTIWQENRTGMGPWDARGQGLGGWNLSVHHAYDPIAKVLYLGTGDRRSAEQIPPVITTFAGGGSPPDGVGDGLPATQARFANLRGGVATDAQGNLYISETTRVRKVNPAGIISTVAGNGTPGYNGDGIPATSAMINTIGLAIDAVGNLYLADFFNNRVRKVDTSGIITTVAGNGSPDPGCGFNDVCGDGGLATATPLTPQRVMVDGQGNFYLSSQSRIRKVEPSGLITTIVKSNSSTSPVLDQQGNIYFLDNFGARVERLNVDGTITRIVGPGGVGNTGDGGPAIDAFINFAQDLALDAQGNLYIVDDGNTRVRRVSTDGIINAFAGNGTVAFAGDGGPARAANFREPLGAAVDSQGNVYIADANNGRIRKVSSALPGFTAADIPIPSEDGSELYVFNSAGRHLRTLNTLTGAIRYQFTYDSAGRLTLVTDGDNNITTIERDGAGNPTGVLSPFNQRTMVTRDANGYLNRITDPANESYQFGYTADGLMTNQTDPRGNAYSYVYDALGRLTRDNDPASGFKTLARTEQGNSYTVSLSTALNRTDTYQVQTLSTDDQKRINTDPAGLQTQLVGSLNGTNTSTLPNGIVGTEMLSGDPRWGLQAPLAKSTAITTPGGLAFNSTFGRVVTLSDPNNLLSLTAQNDTLTINGRTYTNNYAAPTMTFTFATPVGRQTTTTIDMQGRTTQSRQLANLNAANFSYDARGRLSTAVSGAGAALRNFGFSYNTDGYLSSVTDPLSRSIGYIYDAAGRVTQKTLPDGRVIGFGYDANGNLTSITPPGRPAHGFAYSPVDLRSSYTPPNVGVGNQTTYAYNLDRQLTTITRPDSQTLNFAYDTGARLSTLTIPGGVYTFAYDATTGNLSSITAPDGSMLSYQYDGALLTRSTWAGTIAGNVSRVFDNNFRAASQSINGANTINFAYDNDSLLTGAGSLGLTRHAQNGLITGTTLGNVTDTRSYSGFAEVMNYSAAYNSTSIYAATYAYDNLSRIIQKVETTGSSPDTFDYSYDLAGRLREVKKNIVVIATYTYDSSSNRQSFTGPDGTVTGSYDDQDRLTSYGSATYAYTANGELMSKTVGAQTTTYQYDVVGNLNNVTLPNGTQIDYLIDGQERRIGKKFNGTLVQGFLYQDDLSPIAELDGSSNIISRFIYASRDNVPDYMIKGGITYRIVSDHLGSPHLVVDVGAGAVAQRMDYDTFGNVLQDTNPGFQPFGFAGGLYDRDTGLVRFGARDYEPMTGRWTAKDPILFAGGDSNLYVYVGNDPINTEDSSGLGDGNPFEFIIGNEAERVAVQTLFDRLKREQAQDVKEFNRINMNLSAAKHHKKGSCPVLGTPAKIAEAQRRLAELKIVIASRNEQLSQAAEALQHIQEHDALKPARDAPGEAGDALDRFFKRFGEVLTGR